MGDLDLAAAALEDVAQGLEDARLVVGDEDAFADKRLVRRDAAARSPPRRPSSRP